MALSWGNVGATILIWNGSATPVPVAPVITSGAFFTVSENAVFSTTLTADMGVTWAITGGADQALFTIGATSGILSLSARNYEAPADADLDNTYLVTVTATSDGALTASVTISVSVTDVSEVPATNGSAAWVLNSAAKTGFAFWSRFY